MSEDENDATLFQRKKIAQLCQRLKIKEPLEEGILSSGNAGRLIRELTSRITGIKLPQKGGTRRSEEIPNPHWRFVKHTPRGSIVAVKHSGMAEVIITKHEEMVALSDLLNEVGIKRETETIKHPPHSDKNAWKVIFDYDKLEDWMNQQNLRLL